MYSQHNNKANYPGAELSVTNKLEFVMELERVLFYFVRPARNIICLLRLESHPFPRTTRHIFRGIDHTHYVARKSASNVAKKKMSSTIIRTNRLFYDYAKGVPTLADINLEVNR